MCNRDAGWMSAYRHGDERAFAALFRQYAPLIARYFARHGKRPADVEDLVQETFLHLHRARAEFRAGESLRPWLFTIARNVCHDHGRRAQRRPETYCEVDTLPAPQESAEHHALDLAQRRKALSTALAKLSAAERRLLDEHWFDERAFSEIAQREGVQCSTLRVRAHRACQRLRDTIAVQYRAVA